ncbi:MAG: FAD binding domain-containing protein [Thermotogae bacterium]|jgi:xanthine dehydrogenase FAD-binding subunit|nr:FAD binding domain-containing protein [Thermotogota bacterium]MCL5031768.1 FAD binding domain-containing protein [Thermotogota bacterium]
MNFKFVVPKNEKDLIKEFSDDRCALMAGGTDLLVKMRLGKIKPEKIISTIKVPTLHTLGFDGEKLTIGANVTYSELLDFKPIKAEFPILYDALLTVGSPQIRNRATLAGNIMNASPAGDGLLALYLSDALVEISDGEVQAISDFITGPGSTTIGRRRYLKNIFVSKNDWTYRYFEKVGQRTSMTISIASIGVLLKLSGKRIDEMRLAFGSVGPTVLRMREIETFAKGKTLNEKLLSEISSLVFERVKPIDDVRGSADYRKRLCRNLVHRLDEFS